MKKKIVYFADFRHAMIMGHFADFLHVKIIDHFSYFKASEDYRLFADFGQVKIISHFTDLGWVRNFDKIIQVKPVPLDKYY